MDAYLETGDPREIEYKVTKRPSSMNMAKMEIGRLTVLYYIGGDTWVCKCRCGTIFATRGSQLKRGDTRSCGCLHRELMSKAKTTHGKTRTREYRCWFNMKSRCNYKKNKHYKDYGGRAIKVCEAWSGSHGFANFIADMGDQPFDGAEIDRIDNDGDYTPENCRWATKEQQDGNKRSTVFVTHGGETKPLFVWCKELGLPYARTYGRLFKLGWTPKEAFFIPRINNHSYRKSLLKAFTD